MAHKNHYECTVKVEATYIPEQSDVAQNRYAFSYHVTITNTGNISAQLISRHWLIVEADGQQQEVRGLGVVGEQPLLAPKQSYEYTSGTVINTPMGKMHGSYQMVAEDGTRFEAMIPVFLLNMPRTLH
jgi:ApaG protein